MLCWPEIWCFVGQKFGALLVRNLVLCWPEIPKLDALLARNLVPCWPEIWCFVGQKFGALLARNLMLCWPEIPKLGALLARNLILRHYYIQIGKDGIQI